MPNNATTRQLKKLRNWLLSDGPVRGKGSAGGAVPDGSARMGLLQVFLAVLDNHPEKREQFFAVIEKMMNTDNPASLSEEERAFMLEIVEEGLNQ
jgi:hypothetical protein